MSEPENSAPGGDRFVQVTEFAAFADYTPTYIRQLQREGHLPKGPRGMIPFVAAARALIRFLRDEERRSSKTAADARVREARAREVELRIAEREGRLIDLVEHEEDLLALVGMVRSELSGLPARVTRDLQFRRTIEQAVNDILQRLTDAAFAKADDVDEDRPSLAAVQTTDA